jgi:hypothetical protein
VDVQFVAVRKATPCESKPDEAIHQQEQPLDDLLRLPGSSRLLPSIAKLAPWCAAPEQPGADLGPCIPPYARRSADL